jgi:hypothetical protein
MTLRRSVERAMDRRAGFVDASRAAGSMLVPSVHDFLEAAEAGSYESANEKKNGPGASRRGNDPGCQYRGGGVDWPRIDA